MHFPHLPFPSFNETNRFENVSPDQLKVFETAAYCILAPKVGVEKYNKFPLRLTPLVMQDMYLDGIAGRDFCERLAIVYNEQEDARYLGWLKEILGERIEEHLIGDIAPYKPYVDMERARAEGKGSRLKWDDELFFLYQKAQVPEAHLFLYPSSPQCDGYLSFAERLAFDRSYDEKLLVAHGLTFAKLGDRLSVLFQDKGHELLRSGVTCLVHAPFARSVGCPFPYCAHEEHDRYFVLHDPADGKKIRGDCMLAHLVKAHRLIRCRDSRQSGEGVSANRLLKFLKW